jgi:hypothetical protein
VFVALALGQSQLARAGEDDVVECRAIKAWSKDATYHRGDTVRNWVPGYSRATPVMGKYVCDADGCNDEYWAGNGGPKDPGQSSQWKRVGICTEWIKWRPADDSPRDKRRPKTGSRDRSKDPPKDAPKDAPTDASNDSPKDAAPPPKTGGGSPREKATEAVFAKHNEAIKTYCGNTSLAFKVDWKAYEALDFETLAKTQCDRTDGNKLREVVLYGDRNPADLCGGAATNHASYVTRPFQTVCRDHAELRANAAKITTIVITPMHFKFQDDKDAIAYARKTNDYTVLKKADKKEDDDSGYRRDYRKLSLSGTTLVVKVPITSIRGDEDEMAAQLVKLLNY